MDNDMTTQLHALTTDQIATIDLSNFSLSTMSSGVNNSAISSTYSLPNSTAGQFTIASGGTSPTYNNYQWSNFGTTVKGDAEFTGDVKIKGHSILHLLEKIEDRLAILQDPDPKKLEKFSSLKKAYDHYKTLEKLIGED